MVKPKKTSISDLRDREPKQTSTPDLRDRDLYIEEGLRARSRPHTSGGRQNSKEHIEFNERTQSNMKIAPWSFGILPQEHL